MVLEPEVERKLIVLEHAIRDVDERMAEIYRDGAGVSIEQLDMVKKFNADLQATKRLSSALKGRLDSLESRTAPAEQLATLSTNMKAVVKVVKTLREQLNGLQENDTQQLTSLRQQLEETQRTFDRRLKAAEPEKVIRTVKKELQSSIGTGIAPAQLTDLSASVGQLREGLGSLESGFNLVQDLARQVQELNRRITELETRTSQLAELPREIEKLAERTAAVEQGVPHVDFTEIRSREDELDRRLNEINSDLSSLKARMERPVTVPVGTNTNASAASEARMQELTARVEDVRNKANKILTDIYDSLDEIKKGKAELASRVTSMERRLGPIQKSP
jgi:chromosome segregation ATPase